MNRQTLYMNMCNPCLSGLRPPQSRILPPLRRGIKVTGLAGTVIDCACVMDPCGAVAVLDSAIRRGLTKQELYAECNRQHTDCAAVFHLLPHADQRSENGDDTPEVQLYRGSA